MLDMVLWKVVKYHKTSDTRIAKFYVAPYRLRGLLWECWKTRRFKPFKWCYFTRNAAYRKLHKLEIKEFYLC